MATKKVSPVYALACSRREFGYGHIILHVHELFTNGGNGTTIKLSCQVGGNIQSKSYSWVHGLWNNYETINTQTLHQGYLLMRRADKVLEKLYQEKGSPQTFAEYAVRVLQALGVRRVSVNSMINAGYQDLAALPKFDSRLEQDALQNALLSMENELLGVC